MQVQVVLAIKQTNVEWLESTLAMVSDPDSTKYGEYLTFQEISQYVYGDPLAVTKVRTLLNSFGIEPKFTIGETFAVADVNASIVEEMFGANLYEYQHKVHQKLFVIRSIDSVIPNSLMGHVDFVAGISDFPSTRIQPQSRPTIFPSGDVTPQIIEKAYNIDNYTSSNPNNSQAIASFLGQYFNQDDLSSFQTQYGLPSNPVAKIVGTNNPSDPGMEASLDVQYITSTGRNVPTWFISVGKEANGKQEDFMTWLLDIVNNSNSPLVHSISYGDYESTIDSSYMSRTEQEFMKIGISGRSLLFASGDDGTSCSMFKGKFEPMWPASSPHVTSVGGTVSMSQCWDHSGGGFSNMFPTPSYQEDAVQSYLKNNKSLPSSSYFNSSGRGYPDLSVFSVNYDIVILGVPWPVDGTSCAAPTVAGIISLLNDIRLNNGQSTLGFLNPLLYKLNGQAFTDITEVVHVPRYMVYLLLLFCLFRVSIEVKHGAKGFLLQLVGILRQDGEVLISEN